MVKHEICQGCQWNNYPFCNGSYIEGAKMRIDNLKPGFECGQKDSTEIDVFYHKKQSELEILKDKMNDLEVRLKSLERR